MAEKTDYLNLRISPAFKEALRKVADIEHRSIANMIEVLIRDYCRKAGVEIEGASSVAEQTAGRKARR
jgi:hypothetical protein